MSEEPESGIHHDGRRTTRFRDPNRTLGRNRDLTLSQVRGLGLDLDPPAACHQCRARKVKCDRVQDCCGPCTRLSLRCSYSAGGSNHATSTAISLQEAPTTTDSHDLTQAGIKRRRIRCACEPCRTVKAKCSGDVPCARCRDKNISCISQGRSHHQQIPSPQNQSYSQHQRPQQHEAHPQSEPESSPAFGRGDLPTPVTNISSTREIAVPAPAAPPPFVLDERDKTLIQLFFHSCQPKSPMKTIFLHPSTTLAASATGDLDPLLVRTICASALYLDEYSGNAPTSLYHGRAQARAQADEWFASIQSEILGRLHSLSLAGLQALVLLIYHRYETGKTIEVWNLLALAARVAFTLRLNYEYSTLDPITQETRRRIMWKVYLLDRLCSGGLGDLQVCPLDRVLHLRLPSDDRIFERGMPSRAEFLVVEDSSSTETSSMDMDIYSYILRIYATRDRILSYTKAVCKQSTSPITSRDRLEALESELSAFSRSLPADIQLSPERLPFMARSKDSSSYLRLHTVWLQCYLDLYRFLVPGLRETPGSEAIQNTPSEYVSYCQQNVLDRMVQMCDFLNDFWKYKPDEVVDDMYLGISCYQMSQIADKLQHLLITPHDNDSTYPIHKIKDCLRLSTAKIDPAVIGQFPRLRACLREVEAVTESLGTNRNAEEMCTQTHTVMRAQGEQQRDEQPHLVSKGSLIPQDSSDLERESNSSASEVTHHAEGQLPELTAERDADTQDMRDIGNHSSRNTNSMGDRFGGLEVAGYEEVQPDIPTWEPFFAVDIPPDYDPELGLLGLYSEF